MLIEIVFAYLSNSLALMADGIHMLTDVASLGMTYFAFQMSQRPATQEKTFGYYRIEILSAFFNGIFLAVLSCGIIWQALERLREPSSINVRQMLVVAVIGLLVNLISGAILLKGDHDNLNLRGAFLHVMGDAFASVGTIVAGLLILQFGWMVADPIASIAISLIIIYSSYSLINETVHIILQGAPKNLDTKKIEERLSQLEGVRSVHHLHVWSLSSDVVILSVHLVEASVSHEGLLVLAKKLLHDEFKISHCTIQIESESLEAHEPRFK